MLVNFDDLLLSLIEIATDYNLRDSQRRVAKDAAIDRIARLIDGADKEAPRPPQHTTVVSTPSSAASVGGGGINTATCPSCDYADKHGFFRGSVISESHTCGVW